MKKSKDDLKKQFEDIVDFVESVPTGFVNFPELRRTVLRQRFREQNGEYLVEEYIRGRGDKDDLVTEFSKIERQVKEDFGSIDNYKKWMNCHEVGFRVEQRDGKKVIGARFDALNTTAEHFYNCVRFVIDGKVLPDRREWMDTIEKEVPGIGTYGLDRGEFDIAGRFKIKGFANRKTIVTFKSDEDAKKVIDAIEFSKRVVKTYENRYVVRSKD